MENSKTWFCATMLYTATYHLPDYIVNIFNANSQHFLRVSSFHASKTLEYFCDKLHFPFFVYWFLTRLQNFIHIVNMLKLLTHALYINVKYTNVCDLIVRIVCKM